MAWIVNYSFKFRRFGQRRRTVANMSTHKWLAIITCRPRRGLLLADETSVLCPSLVDGATRAPCYGCVDSWTSLNRSTCRYLEPWTLS